MNPNRALIIGAGSAIAGAILEELLTDKQFEQVICISRSPDLNSRDSHGDRVQWLESDYTQGSIERVASRLLDYRGSFSRVFICNGVLHSSDLKPEKRLEELDTDTMHQLFQANAVVPALWLKSLCSVLNGRQKTLITVFSARVGSIEDNRLGGWYSYRASKAALNMLVRTIAIEYRRRVPNVQFVVFHPGTTDTPLSEPFLNNVPADRLFSPTFVARKLFEVLSREAPDENARFIDYAGKAIPW